MKLTRSVLLPLFTCTLCISAPCMAQTTDKDPATSESDARAHELYTRGDQLYAEGRYDEAIVSFQAAYDLSKRDVLLFNLANAYERAGRYEEAIGALEKYRGAAAKSEWATLDKRIQSMRERVNEEKARTVPAQPLATAPVAAATTQPTPAPAVQPKAKATPKADAPSNTGGYVLLGIGGVGLATGTVLALMARSAHDDAASNCQDGLCQNGARDAVDREKSLALGADIGFGVGAAAAVSGLVWLLVSGSSDDAKGDAAQLQVVPKHDGGRVSVSGRF